MSDSKYDDEAMLGDCFKASANLVVPMLGWPDEHLDKLTDVTLVHGIVTGQGSLAGHRYTHAWVEGVNPEGIPMVIDPSNGRSFFLPKALYYLIGRIEENECERYTDKIAHDRMLEFAHYGPWDGAPVAHIDPILEDFERNYRKDVA